MKEWTINSVERTKFRVPAPKDVTVCPFDFKVRVPERTGTLFLFFFWRRRRR